MVRKTKLVAAAWVLLVGFFCCGNSGAAAEFDFGKSDPLAFLNYLKAQHEGVFPISGTKSGWIKREHIAPLIRLIDSKDPCMGVMTDSSSIMPLKSTVGDEAVFMIEGYRAGKYPPSMISVRATSVQKAEIRRWWKKEREKPRNGNVAN